MDLSVKILNDLVESFIDYPDNKSLAMCVVMMGCNHCCEGCQNPLFQNPNYDIGTRTVSVNQLVTELKEKCSKNNTNKIVLSGGDCLSSYNINFTKELLKQLDGYDVCIYTGYDIDYVKENGVSGYKFIKCGRFDILNKQESSKDDDKIIFASPNQILYNDVNEPLSKNGVYYFN